MKKRNGGDLLKGKVKKVKQEKTYLSPPGKDSSYSEINISLQQNQSINSRSILERCKLNLDQLKKELLTDLSFESVSSINEECEEISKYASDILNKETENNKPDIQDLALNILNKCAIVGCSIYLYYKKLEMKLPKQIGPVKNPTDFFKNQILLLSQTIINFFYKLEINESLEKTLFFTSLKMLEELHKKADKNFIVTKTQFDTVCETLLFSKNVHEDLKNSIKEIKTSFQKYENIPINFNKNPDIGTENLSMRSLRGLSNNT